MSGATKSSSKQRSDVERDTLWQAKHNRQIRAILVACSPHLVVVSLASEEQDCRYATDYLVEVVGGRVAARVRKSGCAYRDLTLRLWRETGAETEFEKIARPDGPTHYFYAWESVFTGDLGEWMLVDLQKMREMHLFDRLDEWKEERNVDGERGEGVTGFRAIPGHTLNKHGVVVAANFLLGVPNPTAGWPCFEKHKRNAA